MTYSLNEKDYVTFARRFVKETVETMDYQDSEILNEWEDLIDVHTLLEETKDKYEQKLAKAQAKQPNMEW